MPRQSSTVTNHRQLKEIELAIASGESVRGVAQRFGLSSTAVHRHKNRAKNAQRRANNEEVARIDREINKLIRAQNREKRNRNTTGVLAIARELRNWYGLKAKAELLSVTAEETQVASTVSRAEALEIARALIETEVTAGSQEILEWLRSLAERAGLLPESDGQPARRSGISRVF